MGRFSWSLRTEPSIKRPSSTSGSKCCSTVSAELAGIPYRSDPKCGEDEIRIAFSVVCAPVAISEPVPAHFALEPDRHEPPCAISHTAVVLPYYVYRYPVSV